MIYQLVILMLLLILNTIFYLVSKYGKGKIKNIAAQILKLFNDTIYIQFILITYLDFADKALLKIKNVKSIQPNESLFMNILDYEFAVIFMIFCVILPVFIASFLLGNKSNLIEEEFIGAYTFLVRDFKENIFSVYLHVIFLVRRLAIVVSVHLLNAYPIAQVVVCSVVCWIVIFI